MASMTAHAASAIMEQLVGKVFEYADMSWWPSARSIKKEAEKLQLALPQIRTVLTAVQGVQIKQRNPDFDARMWQFRDAIEAADDVLDEIKYYELEEKVKARVSEVSGPLSGYKRKLVDFVNNAFVNNGVLSKLREAVKGLEAIASDMGLLIQLANSLNEQLVVSNFRETGSYFIESTVVGREKEKEAIIQWLTAPCNGSEQGQVSIFSVFGMGGMGKTTLIQLVCKDKRVIEKFDLILWVCVSDNSIIVDAKTMVKIIIEDITKQSCNLDNLNTLQNTLKEKLEYKKFVLVLDDVWRDDTRSEWEKIVASLRFGEKGSKILLTTRMESVARMVDGVIEGENEYLNLAGLEENDFITLFYRHAFAGTDPSKYQNLHEIGNKIANKLRACPLVAKVIGGVLNKCINFEFWNKILNEDIFNIQTSNDNIMDILKLSYYHLPTHLQLCFRYCSIFPQDYEFKKDQLVKIWMSLGFISRYAHQNRRLEDTADEYLDQLIRKSFFHLKMENDYPYSCRYLIHDLLHDLARCVSEGECLRITYDDTVVFPQTIRHLSIENGNYSVLKEIHNLKKLQTLMFTQTDLCNFDVEEQEFDDILSAAKKLRVLVLMMNTSRKIPNAIGNLLHLRYLKIDSRFTRTEYILCFLKSLHRLYHLEVMEVDHSFYFPSTRNIPENEIDSMCNLINLQYLELPNDIFCNIPWIRKLHSLRVLYRFDVRNDNGYKIEELKCLNHLQKLCVCGLNNISNPDDAMEAEMNKKKNLKSLTLAWSESPFGVRGTEPEIADNLQPPSSLNKLEISYYRGIRSPCWMNDHSYCNLIYVKLYRCDRWEHLPPLGQLQSLEILELNSMSAVKQVGYSLYGERDDCIFPSLRCLKFWNMPKWEKWIGVENKFFFPHLESLEIVNCVNLKRLPTTMPRSLKSIEINHVAFETFELLQPPQYFHALKSINITNCKHLLHMPMEYFGELPLLTNLAVYECPKLVIREIPLPTMLKHLAFGSCGDLEPFIRSLQDLTSLTILHIYGCADIQSLPPVEVFVRLTSVRELHVTMCKKLTSLSGIEALTSLRTLRVHHCKKLNELSLLQEPLLSNNNQVDIATSHELKLNELAIDHTPLLLMEPLRSLRFIRGLGISDDYQVTSLPEQWLLQNRFSLESVGMYYVSSLQSLPPSMGSMCSLQSLEIHGAELLRSLPNLPTSLKHLYVRGCHPELEDLCRAQNGLYWPMISRIPTVIIEAYVEPPSPK